MRRASLFSRDNVPENPLPNEKVRRIVPASDLVARIALAERHRNDRTSFLERSSGWLSILLDLRFDIARRRGKKCPVIVPFDQANPSQACLAQVL